MIRLETERLIVRDYTFSDLENHHRLMSDDKVMHYLQDIQTHSREESERDLTAAVADIGNPRRTMYFFAVEQKETLEYIGEIGYTVTAFTPVGKLVHVGYYSFDLFWGKGYMTEALRAVLRFAFEEDGVYRVTTGCLAENGGSEKVMKRAGLIKEAEHLDWEWLDGGMKTRLEYRLLRPEWERQNSPVF